METTKTVVRRVMMAFLFLGAIYTTLYSISGVQAGDLLGWMSSSNRPQSNEKMPQLLHQKDTVLSKTMKTIDGNQKFAKHLDNVVTAQPVQALDLGLFPTREVIATGYTAGIESTGKTPDDPGYGITYSGVHVRRDFFSTIAADTSIFPIGTILYIPGYGYGVVADTGSAINGNKLDLYYNTVEDVYDEWGKKRLKVFVIKTGKGSLTEKTMKHLNGAKTLEATNDQIVNS